MSRKVSRRSCAIKTCTNSWYTIEKWMEQHCEIHNYKKGTGACTCPPPFTLIPFPTERKDPEGRKKWTIIVNRKNGNSNWQPNAESRICSKHFVDGQPSLINPYPSLDLGYTPKQITSRPPPLQRNLVSPPKKVKRKLETDTSVLTSELDTSIGSSACSDHIYVSTAENDIVVLKERIQYLENQVKTYKSALNKSIKDAKKTSVPATNMMTTVLKNDKKCKFYTGIPNVNTFNNIYSTLTPIIRNMKHWKGPRRVCNPLKNKRIAKQSNRKLTMKEEFLLTLVKLRLGLLFEDLADRFNISSTHASNIFTTWIKLLSKTIGTLVFNPPKEAVKQNLPPTFKDSRYSNVRHIIDCTEIFLEKPSNLEVAAKIWSDYKHHHTAKLLVSINPSGLINFVSECWGGRCSDKYITNHSGFLDIIEPYDTVMADRGFTIREDLALVRAELFIPPGRRGATQMSTAEVQQTKDIANRRIFIEQAIRRMKSFRILKYEMPLTLAHHLDNITQTIAGICNMYPPLPKYNQK